MAASQAHAVANGRIVEFAKSKTIGCGLIASARVRLFGKCPVCDAPGPHNAVPGWAKQTCKRCGETFSIQL